MRRKRLLRRSILPALGASAMLALAQVPPEGSAPPPGGAPVTEPQPAAPVAVPAAAPDETPAVQPDRPSPSRRRDPFWPVGFAPAPPPAPRRTEVKPSGVAQPGAVVQPVAVRTPDWDRARRQLKVGGLSKLGMDKATGKPRYIAYVAGKLVEKGDPVIVTFEGFVYRWKVKTITASDVSFEKVSVRAE